MGIFSRLFGGGQDGEPPTGDDDEPSGDGVDGSRPAAFDGAVATPTDVPASAPSPVRFAPAGSEPTTLPKIEPNMWVWPGSIKVRTPEPLPAHEKPAEVAPVDVRFADKPEPPKPATPEPKAKTGRTPKPQAVIVDSGPTPTPVIDSAQKPRDPTIVSSPPPAVAIDSAQKPRDPTLVMSPPPPAAPTQSPPPATQAAPRPARITATHAPASTQAAPTPAPPVVAPARAGLPPPKRGKIDTINSAFESLVARDPKAKPADGVSTAADLAEVRKTFEQVAAVHVGQVRDVMLELRYGGGETSWLDAARPALSSVRKMAAQMELAELVAALDAFCAASDEAVRTSLSDKPALLRAYQKLIELVPKAFELATEHDRREPIIVEALLLQIEGVERPTIERLSAVGLGKLEALLAANATDLAAVTGLRAELAHAIVARFAAYRASGSTFAAVDAATERKQLHDLVIVLSLQNDDFRRVAASWRSDDVAKKRELRRTREHTFQKIRVALARLGERDHLQKLDKLPFDDRIAMLDKLISAQLGG